MNTHPARVLAWTLALPLAVSVPPPAASAQSSLSSRAYMLASNDFGPEGPSAGSLASATGVNGSPVSVSDAHSFTGFDSEYNERTVTFSGTASASAGFQSLHASASGTISNAFYNADNVKFFNQETQEVDFGGVPDWFGIDGEASFTDTLIYGGTAVGYTSRYILNLSGSVGGDSAFVYYEVSHGESSYSDISYVTGNYNIPIHTTAFVGAPNQTFSLRLLTSLQVHVDNAFDGQSYSGTADFGNTLNLIGIDARDDAGNLLAQSDFTSASGTTYAIIPVPEPGTVALFVLSLTGVMARRRRSA